MYTRERTSEREREKKERKKIETYSEVLPTPDV